MRVVEIFDSIDGEGEHAGYLATFIRLAGCNLRCKYCDTRYAKNNADGKEMTTREIVDKVAEMGNKHVTLTGGEPLIQDTYTPALITMLIAKGYIVNVETNGSMPITPYLWPGCHITLDYKLPSAGEKANKAMLMANWADLRETDVVKFVCKESDFTEIRDILNRYKTKAKIYLSPIWGECDLKKLVEFQKTIRAFNPRIQIQLHKAIWGPDEKGV